MKVLKIIGEYVLLPLWQTILGTASVVAVMFILYYVPEKFKKD